MSSILEKLPAPKHKYKPPADAPAAATQLTVIADDPSTGAGTRVRDNTKSEFWKVVPQGPLAGQNDKPDREKIAETMSSTQEAINKVLERKLQAQNPTALKPNTQPGGPQYIKYKPKQQGSQYNSGMESRIIQMQEMPVDPMEPPKFRHTKVPPVPDLTPVPVLRSPPRAMTKEDQANWRIPPCVSAWKNAKGYTIPLDKRLAADGRGMQEQTINKKHMSLAQALYSAEEHARKETELQARLQYEMKQRQKQKKEEELRKLAAQARAGAAASAPSLASRLDDEEEALPGPPARGAPMDGAFPPPPTRRNEGPAGEGVLPPPPDRSRQPDRGETAEEREERRKRDELREERRRERERERRLEEKGHAGAKRSKLTRDAERDISEKVALGQANVRGGETQYDSRLFNRDQGIGSGFTGDDAYNVYDKALFADRSAMSMYRARDAMDSEVYGGGGGGDARAVDTNRFRPDQGFTGTDTGGEGAGGRTGPVQFEKEKDADPFGLESFISGVAKKR